MIGSRKEKSFSLVYTSIRSAGLIALTMVILGLLASQPTCTQLPPTNQQIPTGHLQKHVSMLSEVFIPRSYDHVLNLDKCANYILGHFTEAGGMVQVQEYELEGNTYKNVTAIFGPQTSSRIVVGAHYDAYRDTPGADDNASGVAGLIELAYLLGNAELNQRVDLVAFTLEEPPYFRTSDMGSARYARWLHEQGINIEAMICLEMIGFFSDEKNSQRFPSVLMKLFYPDRGNYITVIGSMSDRKLIKRVKNSMKGATDLPVYSMSAPKRYAGVDFSDHLNFWAEGYSAVMITDTAFFRNTEYHGTNDTLCRLDFDRMAKVVLGVYESVVQMSDDG